jgi:hypothetical protein
VSKINIAGFSPLAAIAKNLIIFIYLLDYETVIAEKFL